MYMIFFFSLRLYMLKTTPFAFIAYTGYDCEKML